jgi:hypothetical protein
MKDELRERRREKLQIWAHKNPLTYRAKTLYNGAKSRAKERGNAFDLTVEWIEEKLRAGVCEVSGTPFHIRKYSSREEYVKVHPHSPSLDQIQPSGGYTMDNVQVVCDQVNKFKGDRHVTSMVHIARNLLTEYTRRNTPIIKQGELASLNE